MNGNLLQEISMVGLVLACLLLAPLLSLVSAAARRSICPKIQRQSLPVMLHSFRVYIQGLMKIQPNDSLAQAACVMLHLVFSLLALVMLTLRMNLLPILFMQAFAAMALILAQMQKIDPSSVQCTNRALKTVLIEQPLLFAAAIGIFFATGTFKISAALAHPKLLFIELPLLLSTLLVILYGSGKREPAAADFNSPIGALVELALSYRRAFLLLFAGLFLAHSLIGAVVAAISVQLLIVLSEHISIGNSWRIHLAWSWGYVFLACGLNLTWVYLKYWL